MARKLRIKTPQGTPVLTMRHPFGNIPDNVTEVEVDLDTPILELTNGFGRRMVVATADGRLWVNPDIAANEAALAFLEAINSMLYAASGTFIVPTGIVPPAPQNHGDPPSIARGKPCSFLILAADTPIDAIPPIQE